MTEEDLDDIELRAENPTQLQELLMKKLLKEKERVIQEKKEKIQMLEQSQADVYPCIFKDCEEGMNNQVELARHLNKEHDAENVARILEDREDRETIIDYINSVADEEFLTQLDKNLDFIDLGYEWKDEETEEQETEETGEQVTLPLEEEVERSEVKKILPDAFRQRGESATCAELAVQIFDLDEEPGYRHPAYQKTYKSVEELRDEGKVQSQEINFRGTKEYKTSEMEFRRDEYKEETEEEEDGVLPQLSPNVRTVLFRLSDEYQTSVETARKIDGFTPTQVRNTYRPMRKLNLIETHKNKGAKLSDRGRELLEQAEDTELKEDEFKEIKEQADRLTDKQRTVLENLDTTVFRSTTDIAKEEDIAREKVKGRTNSLKKKGLTEGKRGSGVRLTELGQRVLTYDKHPEAGDLAEEITDKEVQALKEFDREFSKSSEEVEAEEETLSKLRDKGLLDSDRHGQKLAKKGRAVLKLLGEQERFSDEKRSLTFTERTQAQEIIDKQPDVSKLSEEEMMKTQQYFLTRDKKAKTVEKTVIELYDEVPTEERQEKVRPAYDKNPGIITVKMGEKTRYQPDKELLEKAEEVEDVETQEEKEEAEEGIDTDKYTIEELLDKEIEEPRNLRTDTRRKMCKKFLEESKISRSLEEIARKVFDLEIDSKGADRTFVYDSVHKIDGIKSHREHKSNSNRYYLREEQKNHYQIGVEGEEAVEEAIEKYGEIDGTPTYRWLKKAMEELVPEEGEKLIKYRDFTEHFASESEKDDRRAWQTLLTSDSVHKALKFQINPELKLKKIEETGSQSGDALKNKQLRVEV